MRSQETRLRCKRSHMPCNLVNFIFGELGIGGLAGTAARGEGEKTRQEKKKGKVRKTPAGEEKKCGARGSVTTTTDLTMSSDVRLAQSLCRRGGPARVEPSSEAVRRRGRGWRGACAALLQGHLRKCRACPHMCSSCHACCLLRQVRSYPSTRYSVRKRFPAGRCGGFFPEASKRWQWQCRDKTSL